MLTKYASFEGTTVLDIKSSEKREKTASFQTLADFHNYRTDDGYLYVRLRAISSRVNKNHDGWPSVELAGGQEKWDKISSTHQSSEGGFSIEASKDDKYGFSTFVGKPTFVDHHNSDPKRTRGVIVDAKFNVLDHKTAAEGDDYWGGREGSVDSEHMPPTEIELLLEIDAKSFPKLAKAIVNGDLDGFSMGCDVEYSKCSHCGQRATSPDEYCSHIKMKGAEHSFTSSDGKTSSKKSYENCYGINFFELSTVFDPADATALAREVRSAVEHEARQMRCPYCSGTGCEQCGGQGYVDAGDNTDGNYYLDGQPGGVVDQHGSVIAPNHTLNPHDLRQQFPSLPHPIQGSTKLADESGLPQEMLIKAPEDVDTLRQERVCPICGSDMDADKCDVCGYEEPPESLQNPDLSVAQQEDPEKQIPGDQSQEFQDQGHAPDPNVLDTSYLKARNKQPTAKVISEMRQWTPVGIDLSQFNAKIASTPKPQGDEPTKETVISDQTTPVTSAFRTAQDMIQAAKRNQENNMSNGTRVAADPADSSGSALKRIDVDGVGGIQDASNEQASKADAQTDVTGKGGIIEDSNAAASTPSDGTTTLPGSDQDNAGFQQGGQRGPNTQTFPNSNEPESAVTGESFPHDSANKGTQPADPVGKAGDRIDVETPPHDQTGDDTDTWSGTNGNGVTKQLDPVTNESLEQQAQQGGGKKSMISLAALKLAETEIELGLLPKENKFNRLAELQGSSDEDIAAETRALAKVKTAGLTRVASRGGVGRVPSFNKIAATEPVIPQPVNDALLDSALFM